MIESWAVVKSMRRRDGSDETARTWRNPTVNWHGQKRRNETHVVPHGSGSEAVSQGAEASRAKLYYMGHALMDHRQGLIVDVEVTQATGYAEREKRRSRCWIGNPSQQQRTVSADKGYDTRALYR